MGGTRKKLSIRKLFALPVGAAFVVYWAKDDSSHDVRLNYEKQVIGSNDGSCIMTKDKYDVYEWDKDDAPDLDDNLIDTSRGYAYFYQE